MARELYLARHGKCQLEGVLLGQYDTSLSGEGRRQAQALADRLTHSRIERVVSSGLRRAVRTAEAITERLHIGLEQDARLNEISYGSWDGLSWEEINRGDSLTARRKLDDWWSVTAAGGEAHADFYERVLRAWESIRDHPAQVTVVVAHCAVNAVLIELARRSGVAQQGTHTETGGRPEHAETKRQQAESSRESHRTVPRIPLHSEGPDTLDWSRISAFEQECGSFEKVSL